jgi:hypothetical protein
MLSEEARKRLPKVAFAAKSEKRVGHSDKGLYPIFDRHSAESAERLKGKHPELAASIDRRAAKYGVGPLAKQKESLSIIQRAILREADMSAVAADVVGKGVVNKFKPQTLRPSPKSMTPPAAPGAMPPKPPLQGNILTSAPGKIGRSTGANLANMQKAMKKQGRAGGTAGSIKRAGPENASPLGESAVMRGILKEARLDQLIRKVIKPSRKAFHVGEQQRNFDKALNIKGFLKDLPIGSPKKHKYAVSKLIHSIVTRGSLMESRRKLADDIVQAGKKRWANTRDDFGRLIGGGNIRDAGTLPKVPSIGSLSARGGSILGKMARTVGASAPEAAGSIAARAGHATEDAIQSASKRFGVASAAKDIF